MGSSPLTIIVIVLTLLVGAFHQTRAVPTGQEQAELKTLYESLGHASLWFDAAGRPNESARDALTLLGRAADEGLDPADYRQDVLDDTTDRAAFDVALSAGMLRFLRHVHSGRVDPRTMGFRVSVPIDRPDIVARLRSAVADRRIEETVAELRPPFAQYDALRMLLARYRSLAADTTLDTLPPFAAVVRPGQPYAGLAALHRLLIALGDLPAGTPAPAESIAYEGPIVDGVKRFQVRHGLEPDGVLGTLTQTTMRTPLAWRVRQIELALERLRWLPRVHGERLLALNIPMFRLWGWDAMPMDGAPSFGMDVIVGRARITQTPVLIETLREVIFRPYWNVPPSIARHEILPNLERDPAYLSRQRMDIVRGPGDDARAVEATAENLELIRQGVLRVRQRPGPLNALGTVKFVFPNDEDVYMHGTPAQSLFRLSRRDLSHGCVRVKDPAALAEWVLRDQPEWTSDRIRSAMAGTQTVRVTLAQPIPVILYYTTAVVMREDGTIHFAEDIYRHDARLDKALTRPSSAE